MSEIDDLNRRLRRIDARLAEAAEEAGRMWPESFARQELLSERNEMAALRQATIGRLDELTRSPDARQSGRERQRQAAIDAMEREQRAAALAFIAKLEAEGDHRQARLWRHSLLTLREGIARSLGA